MIKKNKKIITLNLYFTIETFINTFLLLKPCLLENVITTNKNSVSLNDVEHKSD